MIDADTALVLRGYGINPDLVPDGTVRLLSAAVYGNINERTQKWVKSIHNLSALAYELETEAKRGAGVLLRNMFSDKERASRTTVATGDGPFWHNWSPSLPEVWRTGVAVLVEGPKDARVCWQYGIPAIAYLGGVPSREQFRIISKYATTVVWVPDQEDLLPQVASARRKVSDTASSFGILLKNFVMRKPTTGGKVDPGDLVKMPDEVSRLQMFYRETVLIAGGGYRVG